MKINKVNTENFNEEISSGVTLVDFYAEWCGPCKMVAPTLEKLAQEMDNVKFIKVDVDEEQEIAVKYNIMSIPTLILFKDGKIVDQKLGFMSKEQIIALIEQA